MKTRRTFLGRLCALVAAPWAPKRAFDWYRDPIPLPKDAVVFRGVTLVPDVIPEPHVFLGSFKIGEITLRVAKQGRFYMNPDQERLYLADLEAGLTDIERALPKGTLEKRVRETEKALEADVPRET